MTGFVYFLQAGEAGAIKIGFSATSVERRIHGNQVGCPERLIVLGVVAGDVALEKRLHKAFRPCALRGEWFAPHRRLIAFIGKVAKPLKEPLPSAEVLIKVRPLNMTAIEELAWAIDHKMRTRREFAKSVGIGDAYLSQILSGVRPLSRLPLATAFKISQAAGLPIEWLMSAGADDPAMIDEAA